MYQIIFYKNKKGENEVEEYIKNIAKKKNINKDSKIKLKKIIAYLDLLSKDGLSIGEPYIKHLKDDIWELRPLRDRILFAYIENNTFIILNKFQKDSQRTPNKELQKAIKLLKEFKERGKS